MEHESLNPAKELRKSIHKLARKILGNKVTASELEGINQEIKTLHERINGEPLPKWWEPDSGSEGMRSHTYRSRSLFQGPLHFFSPELKWAESKGPNGEDGFEFHVMLSDLYEGPPLAVHGGYIAGLFDELLGAVQSLSNGGTGYTAKLEIKYRSFTPINENLIFKGWVTESSGRRITVRGSCSHGDQICSEATALFLRPKEKTAQNG